MSFRTRLLSFVRLLLKAGRRSGGAAPADAASAGTEISALVIRMIVRIRRMLGARIGLVVRLDPREAIVAAAADEVDRILLDLVASARAAVGERGIITIESELMDTPPAAGNGRRPHPCVRISIAVGQPGASGAGPAPAPAAATRLEDAGVEARLGGASRGVRALGGSIEVEVAGGAIRTSVFLPVVAGQASEPLRE